MPVILLFRWDLEQDALDLRRKQNRGEVQGVGITSYNYYFMRHAYHKI